jgi:acetoin utilization deacetylase AcuC-like enzyme
MGFCLFNNVAIGASHALARGARRVAIVDWDVHHGNGTQDIFYERDDVLFCSTHQFPLYPGTGSAGEIGSGRGRGFTVNAPLPAYTGDRGMGQVFDEIVIPVVRRFRPDLILVSAGYDAHYLDPLASLQMTTSGFHALTRRIVEAADDLCSGRVVVCLEGGYDLEAIAWSALATLRALADEPMIEDRLATPTWEEASLADLLATLRLLHQLGPQE